MCIFYIIIKQKFKSRLAGPVTEGPNCGVTPPPNERGSGRFSPNSSTHQKHLKFGQCLEIDDRRPLNKFGDVKLPSSHLTDRSIFYRPAFYRLVRKIVNL